jgi:broad specificity phosphatase PhoE
VAESLSDMALADEMDVVVLVTHDAFLKLLLTALLFPSTSDPAAGNRLNCEILNTATTALELDPFGAACSAQLLWLNRIDHFLLSARM